jgi:hypothetical protein
MIRLQQFHRPIIPLAFLLGIALALSACAGSRGFDRQALKASFQQESDVVTNRDIAPVLDPKPQLTSPFRLAVYFKTHAVPFRATMRKPNWLGTDKDLFIKKLQPVVDERIVENIFVLADSTVQGTLARDIRPAAARYNADVVLIIDSAAAVDRYNNGHAAWYATGLGLYVASGTQSDALYMIEGAVWDVRTAYLYGTQSAEGTAQSIGPAASLDDNHVLARAKEAAVESFGGRLADFLRLMKEKFQLRR